MIKKSCLPKHAVLTNLAEQKSVTTLSGKLKSQQVVTMRDLRLPEFDKNRRITQQKCLVFDNDNCNYDIILGANFLRKTGIVLDLDYDKAEMRWYDCVLPLRPKGGLSAADFDAMEDKLAFTSRLKMNFSAKIGLTLTPLTFWMQNMSTLK
jgi:hypothetical protein